MLLGAIFAIGCTSKVTSTQTPLCPTMAAQPLPSNSGLESLSMHTAGNRCLPEGLPKIPHPPNVTEAYTCRDDRAQERVVAAKITRRFKHTLDGSRVDVNFDCNPITSRVEELVFELGSGHGGSLTIWRIYRVPKDDDQTPYHVVGFGHDDPWMPFDEYTWSVADRFSVKIAHGTLAAGLVNRALKSSFPAITARLRELEPPREAGPTGISMEMSSNDFYETIRVRDVSGHELERTFTGYGGTLGQGSYLGLDLAMESLRPLVKDIAFDADSPTVEERVFFDRQMLTARNRAWWVEDRYVRLAGRIGDKILIPMLVEVLRHRLKEANVDRSENRKDALAAHLMDPILALVRVSGWDARTDASGHERSLVEVARDYIDECMRGAGVQSP
jgi:hypothetical protein